MVCYNVLRVTPAWSSRRMRTVSLAASADQDGLLQPELLDDVTLGVLCFAHASCPDSPDPARKHVALLFDMEARFKSLPQNRVLNAMLAQIAPPGAEPLTLRGHGILCFMDIGVVRRHAQQAQRHPRACARHH